MTLPTGDAAVVVLAEALGRCRELSERESRILQRAISRETVAFRRWTADEDRRLLKMHKAGIKCVAMARTLTRSEHAIYTRIRELKKLARVKR